MNKMNNDTSTPNKRAHDNESSGVTPEQKNAKMDLSDMETKCDTKKIKH